MADLIETINTAGESTTYEPGADVFLTSEQIEELSIAKFSDGTVHHFWEGVWHRDEEDGPAIIKPDGTQYFFHHGQIKRENHRREFFSYGSRHLAPRRMKLTSDTVTRFYPNEVMVTETIDGEQKVYDSGNLHYTEYPAEICKDGTVKFYRHGKLHNLDGPAIIYPNRERKYFVNGVERESDNYFDNISEVKKYVMFDGHSVWGYVSVLYGCEVFPEGRPSFIANFIVHREDGPVVISPTGEAVDQGDKVLQIIQRGEVIKHDMPDGMTIWGYVNLFFGIDGKPIIDGCFTPHRENDLPAVIHANGDKEWRWHGYLDREDGLPAVERVNGCKAWYIEGESFREGDLPDVVYPDGTTYYDESEFEDYEDEDEETTSGVDWLKEGF